MMPAANTWYRLYPNDIYKTDLAHPGPAALTTSRAWSIANEFVYRTALCRLCHLPASAAGREEDGYVVSFDRIGGGDPLEILVRHDFKAVRWLVINSAKN